MINNKDTNKEILKTITQRISYIKTFFKFSYDDVASKILTNVLVRPQDLHLITDNIRVYYINKLNYTMYNCILESELLDLISRYEGKILTVGDLSIIKQLKYLLGLAYKDGLFVSICNEYEIYNGIRNIGLSQLNELLKTYEDLLNKE